MPAPHRSAASARNDIITMLKDDHKRVKKAFRDFAKLDLQHDGPAGEAIVKQACADLQLHASLEEEVFYPAARSAPQASPMIDEAEVEHDVARSLIDKLQDMTAGDAKYAATFEVLGEYIRHHIREEESELFPEFTRSRKTDWTALHDAMLARRAELQAQAEGASSDSGADSETLDEDELPADDSRSADAEPHAAVQRAAFASRSMRGAKSQA